jgi:hypothetical protein
MLAEVMKSWSSRAPPKAQLVGRAVGTSMRSIKLAFGREAADRPAVPEGDPEAVLASTVIRRIAVALPELEWTRRFRNIPRLDEIECVGDWRALFFVVQETGRPG